VGCGIKLKLIIDFRSFSLRIIAEHSFESIFACRHSIF
jgi:hypothetical protein